MAGNSILSDRQFGGDVTASHVGFRVETLADGASSIDTLAFGTDFSSESLVQDGVLESGCLLLPKEKAFTKISPKVIESGLKRAHDARLASEILDRGADTKTGIFRRWGDVFGLNENSSEASPVGRLKKAVNFWESAGASDYILEVIRTGYKLPFFRIPEPCHFRNNASALVNSDFVWEEIKHLVTLGCISLSEVPPLIVNPLSVATNAKGKKRLILDLRYVNMCLYREKFRLDDLKVAKRLFETGDKMFVFDIKGAYHHVEIWPPHRQFLGFSWEHKGTRLYFVFNVLAFGTSTGPLIFTKLGRVLVKKWRGEGIKTALYLDDGIGGGSPSSAQEHSDHVHRDLVDSGFLVNEPKSHWDVQFQQTWLGHILDMGDGKILITQDRIDRLLSCLQGVLHEGTCRGSVPVKKLAGVAGQITSMSNGVGPVSRLMTRNLYFCIETRFSWFSNIVLSTEAENELEFWSKELVELNGCPHSLERKYAKIIFSDASDSGFGSICLGEQPSVEKAVGFWAPEESAKSSTWREIKAVLETVKGMSSVLKGRIVKWFTDNQSVVHIISVGSKKPDIQKVALELFHLCRMNNIVLEAQWVPRDKNQVADELSRTVDVDDWSVSEATFTWLEARWGPHSIDRFAADYNAKLERFNARFWVPGVEAVDAFVQPWFGENNWLVPPPCVVDRVLRKLEMEAAAGTLVVPLWRSALFWPILCPDGIHFNSGIVDWVDVVQFPGWVVPGKCAANDMFTGKVVPFRMLALRCDFSKKRVGNAGFCTKGTGFCLKCQHD